MFDLHNVYATSVPLNPVAESSVASAESALNAHFPEGYREYVTTLGLGVLSNYIRVYTPEDVVNNLPEFRNRVNEYFFWGQGAQLLPKDLVLECIWIADTLNGDEVVFHPSDSRKLYLLPRDSEEIFELGPTLNDALDWLLDQAGLNVDGAVTTFDRACQTYSFSLIPVDKMPRWADLKKRILKLNLHDRVEESNQHPPTLTFYIQKIGGGITVAGRGMNYTLQFSHSVSRDDQFLKTVLDQLEELGFIPPLNEEGEMHPAVANLLERTFSLKKHFPCKIPPEQRTPRDVVVSFINVMYAFEKGLRKWNEAGYPHSLAMQLCATITQDLCIPGSTVNSFGNPPQYDPKKEDPQQTDSSSDETEVSFLTEVKDHFQTKHKFVVRKLDGVWKLAEVWSVLGGGFSDDPDRIL